MEPVLQRLGDVTIQRLEKPKEPKLELPPGPSVSQDKPKTKEEHHFPDEPFSQSEEESCNDEYYDQTDDEMESQPQKEKPVPLSSDLKRNLSQQALDLGPEITFKRFKLDQEDKTTKKNDSEFSEPNFSENDISDFESEVESDGEIGLGSNIRLNLSQNDLKEDKPEPGPVLPEKEEEASTESTFLEKLVENAEIPPPPTPTPIIKTETPDDDYEVDIKEKLKEMGEITFASVKKGDKPKKSEAPENEVVITKKTGEDEVTVMSKGNLRRNIREVMDETKLDESTLAAQRQEAERLRRVQEQQRLLREYQRQAQQERMQQKVMSLLQGNNFSKPGPSSQTRIGNTVLVKLPNGQTKSMTKVPRPPFDLVKVPKPEGLLTRSMPPSPLNLLGAPRGFPRGMMQPRKGVQLPPSVSIAPVSKRGPLLPGMKPQSESDSEGEDQKPPILPLGKPTKGKSTDTIEVSSDDDCIVVSESEDQDDDEQDDPSNSGMHTNDEFNQPDEQGRVLVNVGHSEDEPDVFVAPQISRIIKPHQIGGVRFLYDNIVESINRFDSSAGFGCILAHSMGLGKTLQIVTFSDIFLRYTPATSILCIMPINTLQNWMAEYNMWTPTEEAAPNSSLNAHGEVRPRNFNLLVLNDNHKTLVARHKVIHAWKSKGGVLLIGYEQFRLLSMKKHPKSRRKAVPMPELPDDDKNKPIFDEIYTALVNPGPDLVICDEGHRIKNSHASISTALKQLRTKRRVVLTGYPLQNNLLEYWCMVDFVRPNYLGTKTEFLNMFERPIMNGQCIDSTESDIKLMRYRAHVLHSLLVGFVQRRSHTVLQSVLPQKEEYVLLVRMSPFQRKLYDTFMNEVVRTQTVPNPLKAFAVCCKIWNHPDVLYNFLMKRARGDAVDLDLEEVASTVSGVSTPGEAKSKKTPAKPRKTPAKGRNGKPAASVTPYNTCAETSNSMQPPLSTPNSVIPSSTSMATQAHFTSGNTSSSISNPQKTTDSNYGPYMDQFNQPRTSFEGISHLFDDHMSSQRNFDSHFDQNAHYHQSYPNSDNQFSHEQNHQQNSGFPVQQQNQGFQQNPMSQATVNNVNFPPTPPSVFSHQSSSNQTSLLNLDNQSTVTVSSTTTKTSNFPNLPSGISLTPLSKTPLNAPSSALTPNPTPSPNVMDMTSSLKTNQSNYMAPQNQINSYSTGTFNNMDQNNFLDDFPDQNFWDDKKPNYNQPNNYFNNQTMPNSLPMPPSWLKKEDSNQKPSPNSAISPQKSDSNSETKPKINIISDIKLPSVFSADKKINIISDIKIEPKKEDKEDDKSTVKKEAESIKTEIKGEAMKTEEEIKAPPVAESALSKLSALSMRDSKEDGGIPYDWAIELLKDYIPGQIENSAKMKILFCIIKESIALGDRLLVFSQSLITLDLIEQFLQASDVPGECYKWAKNVSYYRLDGSTGAQEREKLINEFNSNPKIHLFLVSTRAGSLGINLIGANRVVVLDASWNPCHDTQAVCRVYRYGQRKPCFVYRLVVDNCLEKKIYDRQVSKQGMSDRVVDECNPDAHLTIKDVSTLCYDDKYDEGEEKDWSSFKDNYIDVVLQKVLDDHGKTLNKEPFQHESLLVDRKEKQLSQQEKRLAKKGYERDKNAARQPSYMMGAGRAPYSLGHRPVASVRPIQQGERPSRWIPAEHWQRQGMTAQEMTLPLDVVIPTNQPEKGNIVLKAGQKVLVLKSPKGVYMQLESGKIVAIKTAIKVKGKAEENSEAMTKLGGKTPMPPQMKTNPPLSVLSQKRPIKSPSHPSQSAPPTQPPFNFGMTKFNVKNFQRTVPKLISKIQSFSKKMQNVPSPKPKPYPLGAADIPKQVKDNKNMPSSSSSEDEHLPADKPPEESPDDIQKRISLLNKNISIQRVNSHGVKQPLQPPTTMPQINQPLHSSQQPHSPQQSINQKQEPLPSQPPIVLPLKAPLPKEISQQQSKLPQQQLNQTPDKSKPKPVEKSVLDRLEQTSPTPFQETLDSITAGFKNPDHLDTMDTDEDEEDEEEREPEEEIEEDDDDIPDLPGSPYDDDEGDEDHQNKEMMGMPEQQEASDQSDEVTYVSDQVNESQQYHQNPTQQTKGDISTDYNNAAAYNNYYNYNAPPYQTPPPPQGYGYPPQHPPHYDGYSGYPPQPNQPHYNYGYQGFHPPQPPYAPPPPQPTYDYNNPAPHQPMYHGYNPYPQQYPHHPPQGMYPPPPAPGAPTNSYPDYNQYHSQNAPASNYYPNT